MTFLEFLNTKFLKPNSLGTLKARHMKDDGLLNTSRPEKPIPDMHKTKNEPEAFKNLKNNSGTNTRGISKSDAVELLTKFNVSSEEWHTKSHMLGNTGIMITPSKGGFILRKIK